jgi:thiol-disulfide isomerase/thioredoxin
VPFSGKSVPNVHPTRLDLVFAFWCPHCHTLSTELAPKLAERLGVPLRLLDIDRPDQEAIADQLVLEYGDWTADYLIPQVFLEWSDGHIEHLLTGIPGPVAGTRRAWDELLARPIPRRD